MPKGQSLFKKGHLPSILRRPYPFYKIRLHNLSLEVSHCICHLIETVPDQGMRCSQWDEKCLEKRINNMLKANLFEWKKNWGWVFLEKESCSIFYIFLIFCEGITKSFFVLSKYRLFTFDAIDLIAWKSNTFFV